MLYKKKKNNINKLRQRVKPHIGIIETTMMYHSTKDLKDRLVSVFTVFVEEPTRHLVLIRYYEDFQEFYNRIRGYSRKCKIQLPKLHKESRFLYQRHRSDSSTSNSSSSSIGSSTSSNNHNSSHGLRKILQTLSSHRKSNADNLELFLYRCLNDSSIRSCSLLKEFLQPQREEDHIIPKQEVQSYVQLQCINQRELRNDDVDYEEREEEEEAMAEEEGAAVSTPHLEATRQVDADIVSSIHPHSTISPSDLQPMTESSIASSSSISSRAPVTIQDFQLIKVIGRGCMGKVLLVRHRKTSRLLALKAISKKAVIEQSQIVHIKAEQQILSDISTIQHPFLIKLHYSFQDANQLFLVLDYHVGGDLATQLRINHTLPPERCRFYAAEIILGIQELHRLGILYRDLKPENILLTADGHLVLTDFGLSKQFYDGLSLEEQRTETFCGTAEYLAPEILNQQPYSYEVDYWSLGMILYEMLNGVTPFWDENRDEMYRKIRQDPLQFPAHFDIETATFIARLLKRDPSRRLGSGPDGALRVRLDPYFSCIDWDLIYAKRIKPPYVPNLYSETDFSHFDSEFLQLTPRLSPVSSDYMLSQSLDRAFEGYSYTNREERLLDSPVSELYSLNEPPPPVTLRDRSLLETGATPSYFVYNGSDEVMTYDEYAESSSDDIIHSSDLIRQFPTRSDYTEEDLPPRPVTRLMMSPINDYCRPESETSSILD
ncbi:Putative AGC protein kinase [Rhizopus microsporus]|nr:Putative AGC protein kinase [Rhizopus microsporus]